MAVIGLIGGSGIYSAEMLSEARQVKVYTPYGAPSAALTVGKMGLHRVVFLPRHGVGHSIPPHMINYRANIWALKEQGVERVLAPSAVGSLQEEYRPGELVLPDQFIDRTHGRASTFYDGGQVAHISMADPFCPELTDIVYSEALRLGLPIHKDGTYVCIQGPRFSTRAESNMFRAWGGHIIGMTLVPEVSLAREARMCYLTIAMVTDYDCWKEGWRVTAEEVVKTMASNVEKVQKLLARVIPAIPETRGCRCAHYLDEALL
ncbi:MAG: S-methyl-5'-thioadenosine phosphorylase [Nitrososphaerota archaeon]